MTPRSFTSKSGTYSLFRALDEIGPLIAHDTRHRLFAFWINGWPQEFLLMRARPGQMILHPWVIVDTHDPLMGLAEASAAARAYLERATARIAA